MTTQKRLYVAGMMLLFAVLLAPIGINQSAVLAAPEADVEFTLQTVIGGNPAMAFVGVGGEIDGITNPELRVQAGQTVKITVVNGDALLHDLTIDAYEVTTGELQQVEQVGEVVFTATEAGIFDYYCSIPGHLQAGMVGQLVVVSGDDAPDTTQSDAADIIRQAADLPASISDRAPQTVDVTLVTKEVEGQLADGTSITYWTFNGRVPGPFIRVREGDTVNVHLHNLGDSANMHSVDFHAVTGPGGGAVATQTEPGGNTRFTFTALQPGLYVYHCATPSVATHIANGMYGLILVEPEGGLPPVDREFYVMQGEVYTVQPYGTRGHLDFDYDALLDEDPEYFTFNGAAGALTGEDTSLKANVGETVRIYFGVGGPNHTSSFHVIGEIFDRVYDQASLTAPPLTDVQTTTVAPGGATVVEFTVDYPGRYILVDHALSRLERGLAAYLDVTGDADPTIFHTDGELNTDGH